jgi:hypothetical protein
MLFRRCSVFFLAIAVIVSANCGSSGGTAPTPQPPTLTSVSVSSAGSPTAGDTVQLTATAAFADGSSQNVTNTATWESSNTSVVTINATGMATFLAAGEADIKATYKTASGTSASGSTHVTCTPKAPPKYTLSGTVSDAVTGQHLGNVTVTIVDGPDAGRSTTTDGNGRYTITTVTAGSFNLKFSVAAYDTKTLPVTLSADTSVDTSISPTINVTRFYGTYNVNLTVLQDNCSSPFDVGPTGTLQISGNVSGSSMTVTIVERGTTRTYDGSINSNGDFGGNGGGIIAGFTPPTNKHEYTGSISGTATGARVDATEFVNFTIPCLGATMKIGYSSR